MAPWWKLSLSPHFSMPFVSYLDETVIKIACESGQWAKICLGSAWRLNLTSISRWRKRNWGNYSQAQISQRSLSTYWSGPNKNVTAEETSTFMRKEKPHLLSDLHVSYEVWKRNVTLMRRGAVTHSAFPYPSASWPVSSWHHCSKTPGQLILKRISHF